MMGLARGVWAMARKDWQVVLTYRLSFISQFIDIIWSVMTFYFISKLVNLDQYSGEGVTYFQFAVVGIVLSSFLQDIASGASSRAREDQSRGTLESLLVEPVTRLTLGFGWSLYAFLHAAVIAVLTVGFATVVGFRVTESFNVVGLLAVFVLSGVVFVAMGMLGAALVLATQQGGRVITMAMMAMYMLSGTVFPITLFPGWVQFFAKLSPLTYSLEGARAASVGGESFAGLWQSVAVLGAFAIVLIPVADMSLRLALRYARTKGTLGTY